jgi:HEAT repeat protein
LRSPPRAARIAALPETLATLADRRGDPASRGAAALVEAGLPPETRLTELSAGSVVRTLVESLSHELARLREQLEETYEGAFIDTGTSASLERLVERLERPQPWWRRWRRRLRRRSRS